jgi:excisionase family DNA binding protein
MSIDNLVASKRYTLRQVAKLLKVNVSTIYRWLDPGIRGHVLASFLVGGRRFVSEDALEAFLKEGVSS